MSKVSLTLASGLVAASLFTGSAARDARADTMSFQNGVGGYAGTFDRRISVTGGANGASVNTDANTFFIDGGATTVNDSGVIQGMIRFDNVVGAGLIPANALVISASLDMVTTTGANSQSNGAYSAYEMKTAFDGTTSYAGLGGDGIYNDVSRIGGSFNRPTIGTPTSARVDRIVQDWANGTTNNGFGIRSDNNVDGWSPNTTGAATVANRPKLTVNYTTDADARLARYQQNVSGYAGTTDSFINGVNGPSVGVAIAGSGVEHGFLDGSNKATGVGDSYDQPYLVKFDGIDLTAPAVTRAELTIHTGFDSNASGTGGSYSVHRILKNWDPGTSYDSLDSDGDPTLNAQAELIANGFIAPETSETGAIGNAAAVILDVTDIVKAWKDGAPNYGFYIGTTGTADGWEIYSSGDYGAVSAGVDVPDVSGQLTPELSILYVPVAVPEPATLAAASAAGLLVLRRRRR